MYIGQQVQQHCNYTFIYLFIYADLKYEDLFLKINFSQKNMWSLHFLTF